MTTNYPPVFVSVHDDSFRGKCGCEAHPAAREEVEMKVENNILTLNLHKFGAKPKIGPADQIAAVRVKLFKGHVLVDAIYHDPMKTAAADCCEGSGCYCCASECLC
jgi:hypothetical protein